MKQFLITPAAGKRLIGKAMVIHPTIQGALESGTIVIIAGTTNSYVVEELFAFMGITEGFSKRRFFRGVTLPPAKPTTEDGRLPDESGFPGDVVIEKGSWKKGQTIFDVVDNLKEGDVILKGANALDISRQRAAILIGHPKAGTIGVALQAVVGRRVQLILPVGLEKRIFGDLDELALKMNAPGSKGARLLPVPGQVFTELDAVTMLTGASAHLVAAGGVGGAEGSVWIGVEGESEQMTQAEEILKPISKEPLFEI
jgi:hypothetical protein